ncbi:L-alanine dehydrogenase [Pelagirhabdus alkalitolerans]|uniref:Alanine dehydrogenase n=1 Tax=Pelagirhabdus alkalitolerans TaxID=1612202 RepID=A0A1G6GN10_9BACI|nr:alanine dehydrogenase [Pelagirhabdus alkalitolerans]SDB83338.1 L-alanine dehydrogenase [Pelagirhabdus alkalitolerans]
MKIGVPKEIKNHEQRVAMTPLGVQLLTRDNHQVKIEKGAGEAAGFSDEAYKEAGALLTDSSAEVWQQELIVKVKEPQATEYHFFREGMILLTYLHLANEPELTNALKEKGVTAIAYETMTKDQSDLPMLTPMSQIAGRLSVQLAAHYLQSPKGGKGILLGGVPGVENGHVVIIGGGVAGQNALQIAKGLGAHVTLLDVKPSVLQKIEEVYGNEVVTLMSNEVNIAQAVQKADIVIGAVLIPGSKAPTLVTEEMVKAMKPGSVIVDIAVDQGGIFETEDHTTTHDDPVYMKHGILHYAVANMPGAVPKTSTIALTDVTIPYVLKIANSGIEQVAKQDTMVYSGINTYQGYITNEAIADTFNEDYRSLSKLL